MATPVMNVNLKKFDMKRIPQDAVVVFLGKRRTGKSTLVRDLLYNHRDVPVGKVICPTEESNGTYGKIFPKIFIDREYTVSALDKFVKLQQHKMRKIQQEKQQHGDNHKSRIDPRAFLLLDDCMYDETWTHDKNIRYLFMNGRWAKVFFLITMQYPFGIPPGLRTNVDFVFILRENVLSNRKRIYENYASAFPSFEFFCQVMDQCTQNYECLVIDNTSLSNKFEDCIYYYKANPGLPDFKIGSPEIWAYADKYRDPEEDNIDPYDPYAAKKLRGPSVQIRKV